MSRGGNTSSYDVAVHPISAEKLIQLQIQSKSRKNLFSEPKHQSGFGVEVQIHWFLNDFHFFNLARCFGSGAEVPIQYFGSEKKIQGITHFAFDKPKMFNEFAEIKKMTHLTAQFKKMRTRQWPLTEKVRDQRTESHGPLDLFLFERLRN